ncbi:hypothetical protein BH20VER3_BH20VER3_11980 [soil metagenome]
MCCFCHRAILIFLTAPLVIQLADAIELEQRNGAAHAYPAMLYLNGQKLAEGEFTQEVRGGVLRIRIKYDLDAGGSIEETGTFRQDTELTQQKWSWRELKGEKLEREYKVDFDAGTATARKREKGDLREWSESVEIEKGRTFAGFGFVLALQNLRDQLVTKAPVELKAVGFTPKPRVVAVKLSYHGIDRLPMSGRVLRGEHFLIQPEIPAIAKLFVKIADTHIWLTPPPSGFLRWEGPLAEPSDNLIRVDLASGGESGPAKAVEKD